MFDLATGYCANRPLQDIFYIGEMASHDDTADEAEAFRDAITRPNSYGAVYFPWLRRSTRPAVAGADPAAARPASWPGSTPASTPGAASGRRRPGIEASLAGAVGLAAELTDVQHGNLNPPRSVNVIRRSRPPGIVALGRPDRQLGPGVALHPGPPDGDHAAGQHLQRHPVGGLRAERRAAVVAAAAQHQRVHDHAVPAGRVPGRDPGARRSSSSATRDDHAGRHRQRRGQRAGRLRAAEAGRVRRRQDQPEGRAG